MFLKVVDFSEILVSILFGKKITTRRRWPINGKILNQSMDYLRSWAQVGTPLLNWKMTVSTSALELENERQRGRTGLFFKKSYQKFDHLLLKKKKGFSCANSKSLPNYTLYKVSTTFLCECYMSAVQISRERRSFFHERVHALFKITVWFHSTAKSNYCWKDKYNCSWLF